MSIVYRTDIQNVKSYDVIKGMHINGSTYIIVKHDFKNKKTLEYCVHRIATREENDYIYDIMGVKDMDLLELKICKNMRDAINYIKQDAKKNITIDERFKVDKYKEAYKDLKEFFLKKEEE